MRSGLRRKESAPSGQTRTHRRQRMQRLSGFPARMACMGQARSHAPHPLQREERTSFTPRRLLSAGAPERRCRFPFGMTAGELSPERTFSKRGASAASSNICRGDDRSPKERFRIIQGAPIAHAAVASDKRRPLRPARFKISGDGRGNTFAVNGEDEQKHGVLPKGLPHRQRRLPHCRGAGAGDRFRMAAPRKKAHVRHCSAPISSRIRAHSGISSREKPRHSFISAMTSSFGLPQRLLEREISSALKGMSVLSQL